MSEPRLMKYINILDFAERPKEFVDLMHSHQIKLHPHKTRQDAFTDALVVMAILEAFGSAKMGSTAKFAYYYQDDATQASMPLNLKP